MNLKEQAIRALRWSERYTKTDMVYLVGSGFWINLGMVFVSLFSLLLYIVFSRVLTPETYGVYQYLLSAAALIGALTLTGMNHAVIRGVARGHEGVLRTSIKEQLRWGVLPLLAALAIAAYYFLHANITLATGFVLIGLFVPINNLLNTYSAYLAGKKDFKRAFIYNLLINIPYYAALALVAIFVPSAVVLISAGFVIQAIGLLCAYQGTLRAHKPNDIQDPETITYGKHLSVMGIPGTVSLLIDNLLVFQFLGAAPLAIYAFATAIPDRLGGFFKFVPASLLPVLSEGTHEEARTAVSWERMLWIIVCIALLGGVYALAAPLVFTFLFPTYIQSVPFSQVYALSMIGVLGSIFSTALIARRNVRSLYIFNTVIPAIQILLQVAGILLFGLWGAIGAKILSSWVVVVLSALLISRAGVR